MSGTYAAQLITKVGMEGDVETKARLDSVGKKVDDTSKGFRDKLGNDLKLGMAVGAASVVALGVAATKMAGDYNAGLTTLVTGAGEAAKNLKMIHDGELQMSVDVGTSVTQLTSGMYMIESAGFHGAKGLDVLKAAAEGAKVGNADLGVVANGVTTIMVDYANQNISAAQATNTLVATVAAGKTTMTELAPAMASVLPTAAAVHAHLTDVAAAMATMTAEGTPAADAATYLRQMLLALEVPGSKAVKTFKEIGLSTTDVTTAMQKSLPGALQLIEDHLSKKFPVGSADYVAAMKDIAGGQKNFQAWLELTGQHLDVFKQDVQAVGTSVKDGGDKITGWTEVQKDFNYQLDVAHQAFDAVLIKVGEQLMPLLSKFLSDTVMPAISNFQDWATHTNTLHDAFQAVVTVVGDTIGAVQAVVGWFAQGGVQGVVLKDVLIGIGLAIATVKVAELAGNLQNLAMVAIPQALTKFGLLSTATKAVAVETGAANTANAVAAGASGFSAMLGPIAAVTLAVLAAKQAWDGYTASVPSWMPADQQKNLQNNPLTWGFHVGDIANADVSTQNAKDAADAIKQNDKDIQQAYDDMSALYDLEHSWANYDPGSTLPFFNTAIVKVDELKSHLDDVMNPVIIQIQTPAVEKADLAVRTFKAHLDDLTGPFVPQIQLHNVDAAMLRVQTLKSQLDDLSVIPSPTNPTTSNRGTVGHATGILNNPVGHWATVGERGPETMYIPTGASILPNGVSPGGVGGGSNQPIHIHVHVAGNQVVDAILPSLAQTMRSGLGVIGI